MNRLLRLLFWLVMIPLLVILAGAMMFFPFLKFLFWVWVIWYLILRWKNEWYDAFVRFLEGYGRQRN